MVALALLLPSSPAEAQIAPQTKVSSLSEVIHQEADKNAINADLALEIANCESGVRQFNSDGSVLQGKLHPPDTGVFQINKKVHLETAQKLGYDLDTSLGNIGYAMYLLKNEGTKPWSASQTCWDKVK